MLKSFISEKFSANIRTEKEVGYIAQCSLVNVNESCNPDIFLIFIVQSTRDDLVDIIQDYIDNHMMKAIEAITNDDFTLMKQSIITNIREKPLNIREDCLEKISILIETYENLDDVLRDSPQYFYKRFDRDKKHINAIKHLKLEDFVDFTKNIISKNILSIMMIKPENK